MFDLVQEASIQSIFKELLDTVYVIGIRKIRGPHVKLILDRYIVITAIKKMSSMAIDQSSK